HAATAGGLADGVGKRERARIVNVLEAERAQVRAFGFTAGGGKDFRADRLRVGHRVEPDRAGGAVDQNAFAGPEPRDLVQAAPDGDGGQELRGEIGVIAGEDEVLLRI